MRILVVQNSRIAPIGLLGDYLTEFGADLVTVTPPEDESLPADATGFWGTVVLGGPQSAGDDETSPYIPRLLDLMRGPFLAAEDADWAAAARSRYSRRFVLAASQLAALIEPLDTSAAVELYERALDIEPLAESLSRRLIRLHATRGDRAEALRAWQACCTMLRVAGGLGPSRETRALAVELSLPDPGTQGPRR